MSQHPPHPDCEASATADEATAGDDVPVAASSAALVGDSDSSIAVHMDSDDGGGNAVDADDPSPVAPAVAGSSTAINRSLGLFASEPAELPVVPSVLSAIMVDALSVSNGSATAESVESLRQIVQRYEQTFKQFRLETESAIATFREQFTEIRRKFDTLKRIRQSLVLELVQPPRTSGVLAAAHVVRAVVGSGSRGVPLMQPGGIGGGGGAHGGPGTSGVRRKRWGKRTSVRTRSDHNGGGSGSGGVGAGNRH